MKSHRTPIGSRLALVSFLMLGMAGSTQAQFDIGLYKDGQLIDVFTNSVPAEAARQSTAAGIAASAAPPALAPALLPDTQRRNEVLARFSQVGLQIQDVLRQMQTTAKAVTSSAQALTPTDTAPVVSDNTLLLLLEQFMTLQEQARASLDAAGTRVLEMGLPQEILQRHVKSMAAFDGGMARFTNAVNDVLLGRSAALDIAPDLLGQLNFRPEPDLTRTTPTRIPMQIRAAPRLSQEEADALLSEKRSKRQPPAKKPSATGTEPTTPRAATPSPNPLPAARLNPGNVVKSAPAARGKPARRLSQPPEQLPEVTRTLPLPASGAPVAQHASSEQAPPPPVAQGGTPSAPPPESAQPVELQSSPPTPADLAPTVDVQITAQITDAAAALGNSPLAIFEFVRNNVAFQPYVGSRKGSVFTLQQRAGNDTDQASLLLALLRAAGIPCRYVRGSVEMTPEQAMNWLGVEDAHTAGSILTTAGLDGLNIVDGSGNVMAIRCTRVWVEAYIPYSNYRGIPNDDTGKTWVPLDPAFKGNTVHAGADVLTAIAFDTDAFLADYISTFHALSPLEKLQSDVQSWLNANQPGTALADVERTLAVSPLNLGLLPASLPYQMLSTSSRLAQLESTRRYHVRFRLYSGGTTFIDHTISLPELITKRLTIDYVGATPTDQATIDAHGGIYQTPPNLVNVRPRLKLDGVAVVTSASASGMGYTHNWDMHFIQPTGAHNQQPVIYNTITAGNGQAVAFDTFLDVPLGFLAGSPASAGSLLDSTLYDTASQYLSRVDQGEEVASRLLRTVSTVDVSEAIVENSVKVTYYFGTPVTFEWTGLIVDADRRIVGPFAVNGDSAKGVPFMKLTGYDGSTMENRIFEDMYGQQAISTIKILELANDAGIGVCTITSSIGGECPGFSQPSSIITAINSALAQGHHVTIPRAPITVGQWSGTGYIDLDPATGAAGYIISGGISGNIAVSGGATVDVWPINLGCAPVGPVTGTISPNGFSDGAVLCPEDDQIVYTVTLQYDCKDANGNVQHKTFGPTSHTVPPTKKQIVNTYGPGVYTISVPNTQVQPVSFTLIDFKLQYESGGSWIDVGATLYALKGSSISFKAVPIPQVNWPGGKPVWGGTSGASGSGETKTVTFNALSASLTDSKTVTVTCGDTETAGVVVYDFQGKLTPDDDFAGRSQDKYGLEEAVDLDFTTDPSGVTAAQIGGLEWAINSGVGSLSNAGNDGTADYDAGATAGNGKLRLTIKSGPSKDQFKQYDKSVVAPSGTRMTRATSNVKHTQGSASAGLGLYYWLDPKDVSFGNLTFGEDSTPSTSVSGFYLKCWPWNSYPNGGQVGPHGQNSFGAILGGNSSTGCRVSGMDGAQTGDANPYAAGSFTWSIPTQYIDDTSTRHTFGSSQNHVSTYQANGTATQAKGGQSGSAALNDPTSGW